MRLTLSVRSFQTPPTPGTSAWPPSLPSVPTSRATRVTSPANELSWSTIRLMVSLSSRISPIASTVIFLERSPFARPVATSAMLRTWSVRLPAMRLTLSVRSFQTPPTPGTWAWPPRMPSVPTSLATRVTSDAKPLSWSTMVLMVFLSSRISPRASAVMVRERSPLATAVVTSAMLRTWVVRLPASSFTLSVRSFHTPATPTTWAWPPSFPSVPTSLAMRVTSDAKPLSWSTMVLMVFLSSRISPRASAVMVRERSPLAMPVVTSAMLRTCSVRLLAMRLTLSVRSFQTPATPRTCAWPPSFPSTPTSRATRVTSLAKPLSWSTMVLMVFFSSRNSPRASTVIFLERSPVATAVVTSAMLRTWFVRLPASSLTLSVRSFQTPATPGTSAWPPSLPCTPTSRATRVTSLANPPSCSTIVLTMRATRRNSPFSAAPSSSRPTRCERSPRATAPMTRAVSAVGRTSESVSALTESTIVDHTPSASGSDARSLSRPSAPTLFAMRSNSAAMRALRSIISLSASAILPSRPTRWRGRRALRSPRFTARSVSSSAFGSSAPLVSALAAFDLGVVGRSGVSGLDGCTVVPVPVAVAVGLVDLVGMATPSSGSAARGAPRARTGSTRCRRGTLPGLVADLPHAVDPGRAARRDRGRARVLCTGRGAGSPAVAYPPCVHPAVPCPPVAGRRRPRPLL